jgi:hypothetical protein
MRPVQVFLLIKIVEKKKVDVFVQSWNIVDSGSWVVVRMSETNG